MPTKNPMPTKNHVEVTNVRACWVVEYPYWNLTPYTY